MPKPALKEKVSFQADKHEAPDDKNQRLANLLLGMWIDLAIVLIERIEIGTQKGWRATYRE